MDPLIVTVACDSKVSYPGNELCLSSTRDNVPAIAEEYARCVDAGAAIAHIHGVRHLDTEIQADGKKLSRLDVDGWHEMTTLIREKTDAIVQFGIAGARIADRVPLMRLEPDMMSVAFNGHDEYFQPDPAHPPNAIYAVHPLSELREYALVTAEHDVKMEIECFHSGAIWNLRRLRDEGLLPDPIWATLFVDWPGGSWTPPTERALLYMTDILPEGVNYNVSVMSSTRQWQLLAMVISMGGHVRVGYEDNPFLREGEIADSNARLVEKVVQIAELLGRPVASPLQARGIIGLRGAAVPG